MKTRTYSFMAAFTAGSGANAYIDMVEDCQVVAVESNIACDNVASGTTYAEISTQPILGTVANNYQGVISRIVQYGSPGFPLAQNNSIAGIAIPLKAGERVYLNTAGNVANATSATFVMHVTTKG